MVSHNDGILKGLATVSASAMCTVQNTQIDLCIIFCVIAQMCVCICVGGGGYV